MHHSEILNLVNGVVLGFSFGRWIGQRLGEETQLSEAEKSLLAERAAELPDFWPFLALFFVVPPGLAFFAVASFGEPSFKDLLVIPWLGLLALLVDLGSRKRQRLVREILARRPAARPVGTDSREGISSPASEPHRS